MMYSVLYTLPLLEIHIAAVILTLFFVVIADKEGVAWMRGKKETLSLRTTKLLHRLVWAGLIVTAVAGFLMFLEAPEYFLADTAFRIKVFFVVMLFINAFVIQKFMHLAVNKPFRELTDREKTPLLLSGAVSVCGWIGSLIAAQFI